MVSLLCAEVKLPKMLRVKQLFDRQRIDVPDIPAAVFAELSRPELGDPIRGGMRIAITCGSRGLANAALITRSVADFVKSRGALPFVVPAMGSHGGATAEGQRALIESYGVTEDFIGCPILSSMETVAVGESEEGHRVRIDRNAAEAEGIIVAGRIKPHTDFHGPYESGIMKMMAIGLGKREGADICHQNGFGQMARMVPMFGRCIIKNAPVMLGFGILENAYGETCKFAALRPGEIEEKEPPLLEEARGHLPLIRFESTDVLVVDRIGKDISGDGMDPNITGASPCSPYVSGGIKAGRTVILDLTPETHGTAMGIGAAHAITRRLFNKIDYEASYVNAITSRGIDFVRIPCILDTDREAVQLALRTCTGHDPEHPRIIRIADSLHTETVWISEALQGEAEANKRVQIESGPEPWPFNKEGNLW
ncbi:MAG: nickel-dependent lactate racemase [Treponema sp.]|nr:nickel-dependent lactate racemase [Treponema sp.]